MKADKEGGACGNATKGTAREEASAFHQEKGTGRRKEAEESRERWSGMHDQAMRSTARVEEKLSRRAKKESEGALWKRHSKRGTIMGSRMVYKRDSGFVLSL